MDKIQFVSVLLLSYEGRGLAMHWSPIWGILPRNPFHLSTRAQLIRKLTRILYNLRFHYRTGRNRYRSAPENSLWGGTAVLIANTWLRIAGSAKQVHFPQRVHTTDTRACWISTKAFYAFFSVHKLMIVETSLYLHVVPRASFVVSLYQHR